MVHFGGYYAINPKEIKLIEKMKFADKDHPFGIKVWFIGDKWISMQYDKQEARDAEFTRLVTEIDEANGN